MLHGFGEISNLALLAGLLLCWASPEQRQLKHQIEQGPDLALHPSPVRPSSAELCRTLRLFASSSAPPLLGLCRAVSARELFARYGCTERLYNDAFNPMLLVGLFAPGEQCSAAAALGMLYYFILAHQVSEGAFPWPDLLVIFEMPGK